MNDFTKDELEIISTWGILYKSGAGIAWPKMGSKKSIEILMKKLQTLIDNYCEHKNQGSISDADYVYYCKDCNVITGI